MRGNRRQPRRIRAAAADELMADLVKARDTYRAGEKRQALLLTLAALNEMIVKLDPEGEVDLEDWLAKLASNISDLSRRNVAEDWLTPIKKGGKAPDPLDVVTYRATVAAALARWKEL